MSQRQSALEVVVSFPDYILTLLHGFKKGEVHVDERLLKCCRKLFKNIHGFPNLLLFSPPNSSTLFLYVATVRVRHHK